MCGLGNAPKPPPPPPVIPPPQATKAPDQETFKRKNVSGSRAGMKSGNQSTILTGADGDTVPMNQLGANTLLGG